jgi:hypothetical protein
VGTYEPDDSRDQPVMTARMLHERSPVDGIRYQELRVVQNLVKMGADITAPRHVIFYLYFPRKSGANAAARVLRHRGHEVSVHPPWEKIPQWATVAETRDRAIVPDFLRETVDVCEKLADHHDGVFDGWEAGLTEAEVKAREEE